PFNQPVSLSRQQAADLAAYILQAGKFPAGQAELTEATLAQVAFPTVRTLPAPAASGAATFLPPPEGNLAELMRAIAFPAANTIFNLQIRDPAAQKVEYGIRSGKRDGSHQLGQVSFWRW